jgi:Zn-dependent M32 family carboxypeptidase
MALRNAGLPALASRARTGVAADEATYNLHILVRYELELAC